jgi:hypothetical protein
MYQFAAPLLGARKLRLFAIACCRRLPAEACSPRGLQALAVAERFADGQADEQELALAEQAAFEAHAEERELPALASEGERKWSRQAEMGSRALTLVAAAGLFQALDAAECARKAVPSKWMEAWRAEVREEVAQCVLLREVAGPLLHRKVLMPAEARAGEALRLALAAYEGDWELMPILADAVEEAGCGDEEMLEHLRLGGPHAPGCWALDLVLGRGPDFA